VAFPQTEGLRARVQLNGALPQVERGVLLVLRAKQAVPEAAAKLVRWSVVAMVLQPEE